MDGCEAGKVQLTCEQGREGTKRKEIIYLEKENIFDAVMGRRALRQE